MIYRYADWKSLAALGLSSVFLCVFLGGGEVRAWSPGESLVVGGEDNYPPYAFLDEKGVPRGFNVDLTRAVARAMGVEVEIRLGPWGDVRKALETEEIDVVQGMFYSSERDRSFDFSPPYTIVRHAVFARRGSPPVEGLRDLEGKDLVVMRGDIMHDLVLETGLSEAPAVEETVDDALRALASGRHDYALAARLPGLYWVERLGLSNVAPTGPSVRPSKYCYAVREGNADLLSLFTEGLSIVKETGRYREIHEKWLGVLDSGGEGARKAARYAAGALSIAIFALAFCSFWSWSLKMEVKRRTRELEEEIAGRKRAEEALRRSEERFRTFADFTHDWEYWVDPQGSFVYVSPSCERLTGYSPEEFREDPDLMEKLVHPGDKPLFLEHHRETSTRREQCYADFRIVDREGLERWISHVCQPVYSRTGEFLGRRGSNRGITERKRMEEALVAGEAQKRAILDGVSSSLIYMDGDMKILWANRAAAASAGVDPEAMIGRACHEFCRCAETHPCGECAPADSLKTGSPVRKIMHAPDGSVWRIRGEPVKGDGSHVTGVLRIADDVTERYKAQERIRENEERMNLALQGGDLGLWDWNIRTGDAVFNARWLEMLGYETGEGELQGCVRNWQDLLHPEDRDRALEALEAHFRGDAPLYESEHRLKNREGEWTWILARGKVSERDGEGSPLRMTGTNLDITRRKLVEEELVKSKKLEATGVLAGGIAHDFNNLLCVILGHLSLGKEEAPPSGALYESLEEAEEAALKAKDLTRKFITFASGGEPLKNRVSVKGLLEDLVTLASSGSNVLAECHAVEEIWTVEADEDQLRQVFHSILENAREAMTEGGKIEVFLENLAKLPEGVGSGEPLSSNDRWVRVVFQDGGGGIAKEDLPRIFDPYFSRKERGSVKGMGLGLSIAHSVVKRHGGFMEVRSELEVGTEVSVFLPAVKDAEKVGKESKDVSIQPMVPLSRSSRPRVLVMDDEGMVRRLALTMFSRLGCDVEAAQEGRGAVKLYARAMASGEPFDLVVLDLTVRGGMGGEEALRKLMDLDPRVKAVIASGYMEDPVMSHYRSYGFQGTVPKPFSLKALREVLEKLVPRDKPLESGSSGTNPSPEGSSRQT